MGCHTGKKEMYSKESCIPPDVAHRLLKEMVHYTSKLAPEATQNTKFSPRFDWYYDRAVKECEIAYCHTMAAGEYDLLVIRDVPSVTPMKDAISIHAKVNADTISEYEEVFRIWKMPKDTLLKRGLFLFDRMVKREDLSLYYSKFQQDRFIEFPDDRFTFDKQTRKWRDRELDSLELH